MEKQIVFIELKIAKQPYWLDGGLLESSEKELKDYNNGYH